MRPAVICRPGSSELAAKIAETVQGETIAVEGNALVPALQAAFRDGRPVIAILPAAIIIRALASLLDSKFADPPILAITPDGGFIMPLLGLSHGATKLAAAIAEKVGGTLVGAMATELRFHTLIDDPPVGYVLHNHGDYKSFALSLLGGEPVRVQGKAPWLATLPRKSDARLKVTVTERDLPGSSEHLVFHAATLAVGVGCERGTDPAEVSQLIADTLRNNGLSPDSVACFASIDIKEDEPAIATIDDTDPLRFFTAEELNRQSDRIRNPSELVRSETGSPSVAEAAALAAAGPEAELIVPKTKSRRATCAVARAPDPILELRGRPKGRLFIVGLGPGEWTSRTPAATAALEAATDWVGYGLYLDLAADRRRDQTQHSFALGEEEMRVRHAIGLAREGRQVALLCSGDAGIYAMAALVCEILELEPSRIAVEVIPGISAFQAAAAEAGAMIGHDFCCISLSDLLTPWPVIEKRITAAAEGDFVIAFYNPRSAQRRDHLERAMAILADHRRADTPVVIASNLGRPKRTLRIVPFSAFDTNDVDMLTLVMVGSSQTRAFKRGDGRIYAYTPRGYAAKRPIA